MILIISMTAVMLYEVFLRYALETPTLWANELTLWIAGFVFLFSGLYAMQQRCHIRIFLLYDYVPRWLQHTFDIISVLLLWIFAFFLISGILTQKQAIKAIKDAIKKTYGKRGAFIDPVDPKVHNGCASCHDAEGALTGVAVRGRIIPTELFTLPLPMIAMSLASV